MGNPSKANAGEEPAFETGRNQRVGSQKKPKFSTRDGTFLHVRSLAICRSMSATKRQASTDVLPQSSLILGYLRLSAADE